MNVDHELRIIDLIETLESRLASVALELIVEQVNIKAAKVAPDRLLYIYDPKTDPRSAPIFLEYEKQKRGKYDHGNPQVIRKLEAFADYYDSNPCQKDFGFRKFYVVMILQTDRRVQFLLDDLRERKLSRRTFLMASEFLCQTDLLGRIFTTPKGETYSLLDL